MTDAVATYIGLLAGALTTVSLIPQLIKCWRTRSTRDVSLWTYMILSLGVLLWLAYGLMISDLPLIVANAVTILIAGSIIALKLRYG